MSKDTQCPNREYHYLIKHGDTCIHCGYGDTTQPTPEQNSHKELENIEAMLNPLSLGVMHKSGQRVYDNPRLYEAIQAYTDRVAKEAVIGELRELRKKYEEYSWHHGDPFGLIDERIQALSEEPK